MNQITHIAINKAHYPVTVLGFGQRIGIWLQGCSIRCKGCVSRDTWEQDAVKLIPISEVVAWCRQFDEQALDGITISGGEPFEQPAALAALLAELRDWASTLPQPVDFLCYSGLPYKTLKKKHVNILELLDAVIPEPFVVRRPTAPLRGSDNQKLIPLSELGRIRYENNSLVVTGKRFQMAAENGRIWFIGIPWRGDMERLEQLCLERGLKLGESSWQA